MYKDATRNEYAGRRATVPMIDDLALGAGMAELRRAMQVAAGAGTLRFRLATER